MMRFLGPAFFICTLAACSGDESIPANVIPQERMKVILFDVLRAQEYTEVKYGKDTTAINANMPVMLQQVFSIYKISKDDFYNSFHYYEAHPDKNKILFDSLTAYTDRRRQAFYNRMQ